MRHGRRACRAAICAAVLVLIAGGPVLAAERIIEIAGPAGPLQGALRADGPVKAAAIIVPGSGPTDRDGNNPLGVAASTYRLLADGLAADGIATLRIDKRGMFGSRRAIADANAVTVADYAADIRSWAKKLRAETQVGCVWVIGHSEGGLMALAAGADEDICGLVPVAAPGRPFGDVLREQLRANPANAALLTSALAAIDSLEAGNRIDPASLAPPLLQLFHPSVQAFLIDIMSYDPARLIAAVSKPVLIVQGQRDLQVLEADARRLQAASSAGAEILLLPDVNHVLKRVATGDRAANSATYGRPDLPLAPGVTEGISRFILRHASVP